MNIKVEELRKILNNIFIDNGATTDDAYVITDEILYAMCRGKKSHGLSMIDSMIKRIKNYKEDISIIKEGPQFAFIDGNNGIGPVVAKKAMDISSNKTKEYGFSIVAVKNPSPFITAGYHAWKNAINNNQISICISVAKSKVAPYGTSESIFGTNPIGFAFPTNSYPIVIDMATTNISNAEIKEAIKNNKPIPKDVVLDKDGNITIDPIKALEGSLLTFGGYKGSAISLMIELLCGALLDSKCGLQNGDMRTMLFFTCKLDLFADEDKAKINATNLRNDINNAKKRIDISSYVPGDNADKLMNDALNNGIILSEEELNILKKYGVNIKENDNNENIKI